MLNGYGELERLGKHCVTEVFGVSPFILNDEELLIKMMSDAIKESGATLLKTSSHKFEPQGVTIVMLLSESHMSIHTWPEKGCAAIDAFTCGDCSPEKAMYYMIDKMSPTKHSTKCFER